MIVTS